MIGLIKRVDEDIRITWLSLGVRKEDQASRFAMLSDPLRFRGLWPKEYHVVEENGVRKLYHG